MAAKKKPAVKKAAKKVARKAKVEKTIKKTKQVKAGKARKTKPDKTKVAKAVKAFTGFRPDYDDILDVVEKKFKLSSNMTERMKYALSSGNLVQDLVLGGGMIGGGMYTWAGGEQSAKSTDIMNFLASLLSLEFRPGIIGYFDPEGSFDPKYFGNMLPRGILKRFPHIFGVKDKKGGYSVKPVIRYYPESRGEQVMDALNNLLKRLPDKELIDGGWYYVFENTKDNRKMVADKYDKNLFSKYNKFYVEAGDGGAPQAVIVVDSWVSLIPEKMDDEDAGTGLAALGRFFSENLPKVKSKLRRKNAILIGVNQLREKPMVQGDPRYEPGGQALKFQSDVRIWNTARSVPHATGPTEEEPSVLHKSGTDLYRYVNIQAKKNKLATPFMQGWLRLWVKDPKGQGHGIDKVWDAFQYLKMTGQIGGTRTMKKPTMKIKMVDGLEFKCNWLDFKALILGDKDIKAKAFKSMGYKGKPFNLYALCQAQIRKGVGTKLYYDNLANLSEDEDDDE